MLIRFITILSAKGLNCMQLDLNDEGGAKELAEYRLQVAKEDLAAAK